MSPSSALYIGQMSGTSMDGLDLALCRIDADGLELIDYLATEFPQALKDSLKQLATGQAVMPAQLMQSDQQLAELYADSIHKLLAKQDLSPAEIVAIGMHGQTIAHFPEFGNTWQIGNPHRVAAKTRIAVVHDIRRMDMAFGGQGAPLASAFHYQAFSKASQDLAIINIGGIANITYLPHQNESGVLGFDSGPGNTLLDYWMQSRQLGNFDENGDRARVGSVNPALLEKLLADAYFDQAIPKSTGTQYFSATWLEHLVEGFDSLDDHDMLATLTELTARSIIQALELIPRVDHVYVCGGGAYNEFLMQRLASMCPAPLESTASLDLAPNTVEACTFAWLAYARTNHQFGNLPSVTGARQKTILGSVCLPA